MHTAPHSTSTARVYAVGFTLSLVALGDRHDDATAGQRHAAGNEAGKKEIGRHQRLAAGRCEIAQDQGGIGAHGLRNAKGAGRASRSRVMPVHALISCV